MTVSDPAQREPNESLVAPAPATPVMLRDLPRTMLAALLIGMLLDQQVPMEWAFTGPSLLKERMGDLNPSRIASMDPDAFLVIAKGPRAIHRFPKIRHARGLERRRVLRGHGDRAVGEILTIRRAGAAQRRFEERLRRQHQDPHGAVIFSRNRSRVTRFPTDG